MARRLGPQGIYALISRVTGMIYVGSAKDVEVRRRKHLGEMQAGEHHNWKLQVDAKRYGVEQFIHVVLEIVEDAEQLFEREQFWMDELEVVATGYNIRPRAEGPRGVKRRPETREKMRRAALGRRHTEESRRKMSASHVGKVISEESRRKMSEAHLRRAPLSEEQREQRYAHARKPKSEETKAKMAAARRRYYECKREEAKGS